MKIKALEVYKHDEEAEENGKWAPIAEGVEFKIRRLRSKIVQTARDRIYGPFERAMGPKTKELPEAIEKQCTIKLLSTALVTDWRGDGMVDDDGNPIPFTAENAAAIFSDEETGKDLRGAVINLSTDGDFFAPESETAKIDEGNSSITSTGTSSTENTSTT